MTETTPVSALNPSKGKKRLATVGLPILNVECPLPEQRTGDYRTQFFLLDSYTVFKLEKIHTHSHPCRILGLKPTAAAILQICFEYFAESVRPL